MVRPYDAATDADALWAGKRAFELGLGSGTGGDEKRAQYEDKLTDEYRTSWLAWVDRCVEDDERCVLVEPVEDATGDGVTGDGKAGDDVADDGTADDDTALAGYVFVLPERLAFVWDAAVLNELYVGPEYRGTGVADDLLTEAVAVARSMSLPLDRMVLDVDRNNDRARAFYERHGFDHWGEMVARDL